MRRFLSSTVPTLLKQLPKVAKLLRKYFGPADVRYSAAGSTASQVASEVYIALRGGAPSRLPARLIAFYLPQYHPIPENDAWWGEGFTEWTNVRPAKPQFRGHYQPHMPGELGYYNLLDARTMARQVALAKRYGIGGFCFYFYWFGGKTLLEAPLLKYLADTELDFPFCLCWANENWTRAWDGAANEVLIGQKHSPEDDLAFITHVAKYLKDPRYLRVGGRPVLVLYRPGILPSARATAARWREGCREAGVGEIFLAYTQSFDCVDPASIGFDAAIEFPPNNMNPPPTPATAASEGFSGKLLDWAFFVRRSYTYRDPGYPLYRGVCPSWDNTPRRGGRATVFQGSSPFGYQKWLENAVADTCQRIPDEDARLVFVNAWNEWGEGAHLEPDQRYGYAYLEATRDALLTGSSRRVVVVSHDAHPHGAQFLALGIARGLRRDLQLDVEIVLLRGGKLGEAFASLAPTHDFDGVRVNEKNVADLARSLVRRGFLRAIVNTTVSGEIVPIFAEAGIECVSLIHEMPGVIEKSRLQGAARQIAATAARIVFPAEIVATGYARLVGEAPRQRVIRPQGLYRRNEWRFSIEAARRELREKLKLPADARIVLAVGYADHRKGVDLFAECAANLVTVREDVHFVWIGHWRASAKADADAKLRDAKCRNHVHFVGFDAETALYHAGADVYALTSREDPFPNVVLESFDVAVPVVAFASTGGGADLVGKTGGLLVPSGDTKAFSQAICRLLDDPVFSGKLGNEGQQYLDKYLGFRPYLFDLCEWLGIRQTKVSVIVPNFNYAQYIEARLTSVAVQTLPYFELIILDDASTDGGLEKVEKWVGERQIEVRLLTNSSNSGNVFAQWRRGVAEATGDYVWIAEADDTCDPDFLETVVPPMASADVVMSYCESRQIDAEGRALADNYLAYCAFVDENGEKYRHPYITDGKTEILSSLAVMNTIPNVSAVLFRRDVLASVFEECFDEICSFRKAGDWLVYYRVLQSGRIAFSPRAANCHRRHKKGVIVGGDGKELVEEIARVQDIIACEMDLIEDTRKRAADYRSMLCRQFGLS